MGSIITRYQKIYSCTPDKEILDLTWDRNSYSTQGKIYKSRILMCLFVCVEVLQPSQPNGVMSSAISLPNHTFTGQA